ncbi:hypothetical protein CDAR_562711 [Caerostris darwini]|uniref:Uncharacterized protein n=1 Tax=Caerostris darwini TaxID=1538125 RepID=A0AAV4X5P5_9ARAC|nr:hypothetical protein CDAR_562711 [Caerostris darwini]
MPQKSTLSNTRLSIWSRSVFYVPFGFQTTNWLVSAVYQAGQRSAQIAILKVRGRCAEHHEGIAGMDRSETGAAAAACDGSLGSSRRLLPQLLPCVLSSARWRSDFEISTSEKVAQILKMTAIIVSHH